MNDFYKKPLFYFIAAPLLLALWPLLLWTVYLPRVQSNLEKQVKQYKKARQVMNEILVIDPERIDFADVQTSSDFDYASAIDKIALSCGISATAYRLNSSLVSTSGGQKSQTANINLESIDIERFAKFLSTLQLRWSNLQCTRLNLRKIKGAKNSWDVDMVLKYYF